MADNKQSRGLNTENEIANAIRGLKAIKREAKETLRTLRDIERTQKSVESE